MWNTWYSYHDFDIIVEPQYSTYCLLLPQGFSYQYLHALKACVRLKFPIFILLQVFIYCAVDDDNIEANYIDNAETIMIWYENITIHYNIIILYNSS